MPKRNTSRIVFSVNHVFTIQEEEERTRAGTSAEFSVDVAANNRRTGDSNNRFRKPLLFSLKLGY
ncbi:hypothetical protein E4U33_007970 [Claviceps sp. LM78 group G4]|nr:hypothetical protein E4U33_007970 [Claviceps sp. LM78 group G4]